MRATQRKQRTGAVAVTLTMALLAGGCAGSPEAQAATDDPTAPNIVLILTDDQRADTLRFMPNVQQLLVHHGVRFDAGYVVNPVCCPSRASILTGAYSHTTGVYTNREKSPYGGFAAFDDSSTIATWLQGAGYRTGLFGKYLNGYDNTTYVPPGWDRWFSIDGSHGAGGYYGYTAVSDGVEMAYGSAPADYGQTVLRRQAVSFIRGTDAGQPLFLYWATPAPHSPAIPQPSDRRAFAGLEPWRPASYDEADVSDKPGHIRWASRLDAQQAREIDRFRLQQLRSLQAVDRAVAAIVDTLRDVGRLEDTMIVFTSDNGMFWGEHRLHGKSEIYEEAIAVPFVVRYDALLSGSRNDDHLALNIDLAPTFADLAGIEAPGAEGRSLLPLLESADAPWRDAFLIEHLGNGGPRFAPTFCAVHTERYVLVRYDSGEQELYDLQADPHEMVNRSGWNTYDERQHALRVELHRLCDPLPPDFSF